MDYVWAQKLGMIRKPSSFVSSICDDRGEELTYSGMKINDVFSEEIGIGPHTFSRGAFLWSYTSVLF